MITRKKVRIAMENEGAKMGIPRNLVWPLYEESRNYLPDNTTMWGALLFMRDAWANRPVHHEMTVDEGVGWA